MTFKELINQIDLTHLNIEFYQSTLCEDYKNVNENNYGFFIKEANEQIKTLVNNDKFHAYFIVDWRVNFSKLFEYIQNFIVSENWDVDVEYFMDAYDNNSAFTLYERLCLNY